MFLCYEHHRQLQNIFKTLSTLCSSLKYLTHLIIINYACFDKLLYSLTVFEYSVTDDDILNIETCKKILKCGYLLLRKFLDFYKHHDFLSALSTFW